MLSWRLPHSPYFAAAAAVEHASAAAGGEGMPAPSPRFFIGDVCASSPFFSRGDGMPFFLLVATLSRVEMEWVEGLT